MLESQNYQLHNDYQNETEKFQEIIRNDLKSMQNLVGFYKILAKTNRRLIKEQKLKND
jgi:hypothetical protein